MEQPAPRNSMSNLFLAPKGAATSSSANIDYSKNEVFTIGSDIGFQWATNQTSYQFLLYQQVLTFVAAKTGPVIYDSNVNLDSPPSATQVQTFHWTTQLYNMDLTISNVFFLWARSNGEMTFTSNYFNISNAQPPSSSTSLTSTSLTSTTAPTSTGIPTQTDVSRPSQSSAAGTSDNSSKVGIGAGVGIGACFLVAVCLLCGYLLARKKRAANDGHEVSQQPPPKYEHGSTVKCAQSYQPSAYPARYYNDPHGSGLPEPKELSSRYSAVELPDGRF